MLLLAERKLDNAFRVEVAYADDTLFVSDRHIVDTDGAALDMTAGFTVGGCQSGCDEER